MVEIGNLNHIKNITNRDKYIGRAHGNFKQSTWCNPFIIGKDGDRKQVIDKYRLHILYKLAIGAKSIPKLLRLLDYERLLCWCTPEPCHGEVLVELANLVKAGAPILDLYNQYTIGKWISS